MEIDDIREAVRATIRSVAPDTDMQRIRSDRPLREQIDLDSIDWLNVIADLRDRLSIEIPASDLGRFATLDSIVAYAASRRAEPPGERLRATAAGAATAPAPTPATAELPCTRHLVNGTPVVVRPMRADDSPLEADFVRRLSGESRYERFMVTLRELSPAKLKYLTDVDQVRHVALAATVDRDAKDLLVGAVRYIVDPAGTGCEFAIAIDDAWAGSGLAGILMHDLMNVARSRGLTTMEGIVLTTNHRMLKFTRQLGFRGEHDADARDTVRMVRAL